MGNRVLELAMADAVDPATAPGHRPTLVTGDQDLERTEDCFETAAV